MGAQHLLACAREVASGDLDKLLAGAALNARLTEAPHSHRTIHASSIYECLRKQGYALLGYEPLDAQYNPDNQLAADVGNLLHARLQGWMQLEEHGLLYCPTPDTYAIELALDDEHIPAEQREYIRSFLLGGRIDAILRISRGRLAIFDIKTVDAEKFSPEYPYLSDLLAKYIAQVMCYMHYWRSPEGECAYTAFVYMIRRDKTKLRRLFEVEYNPVAWAVEQDRLTAAVDRLRGGSLPVGEPSRGTCRYCEYKRLCPDCQLSGAKHGQPAPVEDPDFQLDWMR